MIIKREYQIGFYNLILFFCASVLLQSCGAHKKGQLQITKSDLVSSPVKLLIDTIGEDSTKVRLFIPTEFELKNNLDSRLKLSGGYLSLRGGNVQSGSIDVLINNKLELALREIKFNTGESRDFKAYSNIEVEQNNTVKRVLEKLLDCKSKC